MWRRAGSTIATTPWPTLVDTSIVLFEVLSKVGREFMGVCVQSSGCNARAGPGWREYCGGVCALDPSRPWYVVILGCGGLHACALNPDAVVGGELRVCALNPSRSWSVVILESMSLRVGSLAVVGGSSVGCLFRAFSWVSVPCSHRGRVWRDGPVYPSSVLSSLCPLLMRDTVLWLLLDESVDLDVAELCVGCVLDGGPCRVVGRCATKPVSRCWLDGRA